VFADGQLPAGWWWNHHAAADALLRVQIEHAAKLELEPPRGRGITDLLRRPRKGKGKGKGQG
jgi:hypothetical protein